jgi:hypothetical protein
VRNLWQEHLGGPAAWGLIALALAALLLSWTLRSNPTDPPDRSVVASAETPGGPATLPARAPASAPLPPGHPGGGGPQSPKSLALRQAEDLDRLIALAHRLGLATPEGADRSRPDESASAPDPGPSRPAGGEDRLRWRVELRLSGLPVALDAFVAALAQEVPHARIDGIAWPSGVPASGPVEAAELSLSLRYRTVTE